LHRIDLVGIWSSFALLLRCSTASATRPFAPIATPSRTNAAATTIAAAASERPRSATGASSTLQRFHWTCAIDCLTR